MSKKYENTFDKKIQQFVNSDLLREEIELDYGGKRDKISIDDTFRETKLSKLETKKSQLMEP